MDLKSDAADAGILHRSQIERAILLGNNVHDETADDAVIGCRAGGPGPSVAIFSFLACADAIAVKTTNKPTIHKNRTSFMEGPSFIPRTDLLPQRQASFDDQNHLGLRHGAAAR